MIPRSVLHILLFALALAAGLPSVPARATCTAEELRRSFDPYFNPLIEAKRVYDLVSKLGFGGTSQVHLGRIPEPVPPEIAQGMSEAGISWPAGTPVAVKVPFKTIEESTIVREGQVMRQLAAHDPGGLFIRGFFDPVRFVVVMEVHPEMIRLDSWLEQGKKGAPRVEGVIKQLHEALGVLRQSGIVHSDLKPGNILINPDTGRIKILDFGIAARVGGYPNETNKIRGWTEEWASPEQLRNEPASQGDDLYSVHKIEIELRDAIQE